MLRRDIENMTQYYALFAPQLLETRYAEEIWHIYKEGNLTPDTPLSGEFQDAEESSDVDGVLAEIQAVLQEEEWRQARQAEDL